MKAGYWSSAEHTKRKASGYFLCMRNPELSIVWVLGTLPSHSLLSGKVEGGTRDRIASLGRNGRGIETSLYTRTLASLL
jgi:hypothetical protein